MEARSGSEGKGRAKARKGLEKGKLLEARAKSAS